MLNEYALSFWWALPVSLPASLLVQRRQTWAVLWA
jgi:hypothetical protein